MIIRSHKLVKDNTKVCGFSYYGNSFILKECIHFRDGPFRNFEKKEEFLSCLD